MEPKSPKLPATPQYEEDPRFKQGLDQLFGLGGRLTNFNFEGGLSPLAETISTSPETTKMFFEGMKAELDPIFRDIRQDTMNQLAASNQLESSVTANRLATIESDLQNKYITSGTTFGLADISRALQNRITLFSKGLDVIGQGTAFAQKAEGMKNEFNLESYENRVAADLMEPEQGGWGGALKTGLGAGLTTFALTGNPFASVGVGLGAGALGYFAKQGTGRDILSAGNLALSASGPRASAASGREAFDGGLTADERIDRLKTQLSW